MTASAAQRMTEEIMSHKGNEAQNDNGPMNLVEMEQRLKALPVLEKRIKQLETDNGQYALCIGELNRQLIELRRELASAQQRLSMIGVPQPESQSAQLLLA